MEPAVSLPATIEKEIEALIRAGYYSSKSDAVKDAFRILLDTKPALKLASAINSTKPMKYLSQGQPRLQV